MTEWPKVGFIAGTLGRGGAERQLWEQCRVLVEAGAVPTVLCLTRDEHWHGPLRDLGVEPVWVGRRAGRVARLATIVTCLARSEVEVVQASHGMTNLYAAAAGRLLRKPSVGALRTTPDRVVASLGRLGRGALRWPDRLAGNSRRNLAAAAAFGVPSHRCVFLPNVVDLDRFSPDSANAAPAAGVGSMPSVAFVGRLGPEKRVDVLIEAIALLRRSGSEVRSTIVGDGPMESELRSLAKRLHVEDLVCFAGQVDRTEDLYPVHDLMVLPSEREGTPNVALEAMACGIPVVGTPVGDVEEILGGAGIVVPVGDSAALAGAVRALLTDPVRRRSLASLSRSRVEGLAGAPALEEAMAGLYAGLTGRSIRRTSRCAA